MKKGHVETMNAKGKKQTTEYGPKKNSQWISSQNRG